MRHRWLEPGHAAGAVIFLPENPNFASGSNTYLERIIMY
jgi:hypothetical protein